MTAQQRRVKVKKVVVADCRYEVVYDDHGELTLLGRFPVRSAAQGYQGFVRRLTGPAFRTALRKRKA